MSAIPNEQGQGKGRSRELIPKDLVLSRLDFEAEYVGMGIKFARTGADPNGFRKCFAKGREERRPSASVNIRTGWYKDHAETGESLSFWDFAIKYGNVGSEFKDVLIHYANKAGVSIGMASGLPEPSRKSGRSGALRNLGEPSKVVGTQVITENGDATVPRRPKQSGTLREPSKAPGKADRKKGYSTPEAAIKATERTIEGKAAGSWIYRDKDGSEAFRVVRFDLAGGGKQFRPLRPDSTLGWAIADPAGLLPLYGLPELAEPGTVFVFEGEKIRDLARGLGLVATTSSHGANSAAKSDWSPLAGREVVIVPDRDEAGERYAAEVVKFLAQLEPAPSIRLLRLPGLELGEDLEQWIEKVPDTWDEVRCREELVRLAIEAPDPTKPPPPTDEELGLTDLSTVNPTEVDWLWHNRMPLGKITLLAGEGGIGKTFLALDIAARISRGMPWPDRAGDGIPPGDVIILTAEDDLEDTIVPRLIKRGAALNRIAALGTAKLPNGKLSPFTLADIDRLDRVVDKRPATRLIIVDPVTAFLGRGIDDNKNAELRGLLGPLAEFAGRRRVAILCITHFNKNASPKAASRVIGSVAYSNAARSTWCVVMDQEQDGRRLMLPVKNNLSPDRTGLAYRLVDGLIEWEPDPIHERVNDILAGESKGAPDRKEMVKQVIQQVLADGPLPSDEVIRRCAAKGVGKNRVWENKEAAGVMVKKADFGGGWTWSLAELPTSQGYPSIPKDTEGSRTDPSIPKAPEPTQASLIDEDTGWISTLPMPKRVPDNFKPTHCQRCKASLDGEGFHLVWDGDQPLAECWDCANKLGA